MLDLKNPDNIGLLTTILGSLGTILSLIWMKVIKPIIKLIQNQENIINAINDVKKELTTNGGNSLKDAIIDLRKTCHRIEIRQRIIEQRTKAALHYSNIPLFETDQEGRLVWHNSNFFNLVKSHSVEGFDWLNFIKEEEREELLEEFKSCLKYNRKFIKITQTEDEKKLKIVGYPYRISESEQGGFLVSISETNEV